MAVEFVNGQFVLSSVSSRLVCVLVLNSCVGFVPFRGVIVTESSTFDAVSSASIDAFDKGDRSDTSVLFVDSNERFSAANRCSTNRNEIHRKSPIMFTYPQGSNAMNIKRLKELHLPKPRICSDSPT